MFVVVEAASSYELSLDGDHMFFFMIVVVLAAKDKVKSFLFTFGCYNIMLLRPTFAVSLEKLKNMYCSDVHVRQGHKRLFHTQHGSFLCSIHHLMWYLTGNQVTSAQN